jgi:type II secretory pathway pseudopilin PulG
MSRLPSIASERGSILVEILIGTLLLGMATTAVLNGLDGAQDTGRRNKDRSVAATLAQQDLERMRSMSPTVLSNFVQTRTVTVAGVGYTVASSTDWVVDDTGLVSCTSDDAEAEYMRLTSTVHSPASVATPVTATSLLTPPPGAFAEDTGTAAVKLTDRNGQPLAGVDVDLEGPGSLSGTTNDAGCAIFAFIEVGTWTAEVDGGLVSWNGLSPAQSAVTVAEGKTSLTQIELDVPASLRAHFETPTGAPAAWTSVSVANPKLPGGFQPFPSTGEGTSATSKDADGLFPFHDGYGVYAGSCDANNPAIWDGDYFETSDKGYAELDPGELLEPVEVVLPVVRVTVRRSGVLVDARVTVTQRDSAYDCTATVSDTSSIGSDGFVEVAVPFGHYRVCAQYTHSGTTRRQRTASSGSPLDPNLTTSPSGNSLEKSLDMTIPTSGGSGSCP